MLRTLPGFNLPDGLFPAKDAKTLRTIMSAQWTYRRMLPSFSELTDIDIVETFLEYSENASPIQTDAK